MLYRMNECISVRSEQIMGSFCKDLCSNNQPAGRKCSDSATFPSRIPQNSMEQDPAFDFESYISNHSGSYI